jgi:hypothetical protein
MPGNSPVRGRLASGVPLDAEQKMARSICGAGSNATADRHLHGSGAAPKCVWTIAFVLLRGSIRGENPIE